MKAYAFMFDDDVAPSTGKGDHLIDCTLINKQDEEDTNEEAMG